MGKVTDATGIQFRMLNATKGPAVWTRQELKRIKSLIIFEMKKGLEKAPNLFLKQEQLKSCWLKEDRVIGVEKEEGIAYHGKTVVISSGTFMRGLIHIGETNFAGGRAGDQPSVGLSASLEKYGLTLERL